MTERRETLAEVLARMNPRVGSDEARLEAAEDAAEVVKRRFDSIADPYERKATLLREGLKERNRLLGLE